MRWFDDWPLKQKRFEALWNCEIVDRPCVAVQTLRDGHSFSPPEPAASDDERFARAYDAQWLHKQAMHRFENSYFGGDAMPCVFPNFGTGGHAKYFKGCKFSFAEGTVWYEPTLSHGELPQYIGDESILMREKEVLADLAREGMGKYFVSMPDNCGNIDALAHLRGTENLLADMLDDPAYVKAALGRIQQGFFDSCDSLLNILRTNNLGGSYHSWMNTWNPGYHMQLQVDYSVMISPEMFAEFALDELRNISNWLDAAIYHLDGIEQLRHLEHLLSMPNIRMIQWTHVAGQPSPIEFISSFKRIQQSGRGLVLIVNPRELRVLLENLSPKGVMYIVNGVSNEGDARDIVSLVEKSI